MEPAIGLIGLLAMAFGVLNGISAHDGAAVIVGTVAFTGGLISVALALGLGHLRKIRKTLDDIAKVKVGEK